MVNRATCLRRAGVPLLLLTPLLSACTSLLKADDSTFARPESELDGATKIPSIPLAAPLAFEPPVSRAGTGFGIPIVLSGNLAAAGATFDDAETKSGIVHQAGATYLLDWTNRTLSPRKVVVPDPRENEGLLPPTIVPDGVIAPPIPGFNTLRLALNDPVLVIGVPSKEGGQGGADGGASDSGAVYIYDVDALDAPPQEIVAPVPTAEALFGESLSLSGPWLAIGAPGDANGTATPSTDESAPKSGAVYLYRRNSSSGTFENTQYIKAPVIGAQDWFGHAVAIDDDLMAIGATAEDGSGHGATGDPHFRSSTNSGAVYVYRLVDDVWTFEKYLKPKTNVPLMGPLGGFGWSVAVSGTRIAVGAAYAAACTESGSRIPGRGVVHVIDTTTWEEDCMEPASGVAPVWFGWSVAISGDRMLAGALFDTSGDPNDPLNSKQPASGAAYLFEHGSGGWAQAKYIKSPAPRGGFFGFSTWLGPDHFAIGSDDPIPKNASDPPDSDLVPSGAFYVYSLEQ